MAARPKALNNDQQLIRFLFFFKEKEHTGTPLLRNGSCSLFQRKMGIIWWIQKTKHYRFVRQDKSHNTRIGTPAQCKTPPCDLWSVELGKKNGEVETQAPPLLSHLYGFILAVLTATVGEASNGDTVHPQLSAVICALWSPSSGSGSTNKVAPCSYFQKRVNIVWSRWRDLMANPP